MAIPLRSLKPGRYVRVEDLGGFPLELRALKKRTPVKPRPKAPGIYVDLQDPRLSFSYCEIEAESAVRSALIFVGTERTAVGRFELANEAWKGRKRSVDPDVCRAVCARTPLRARPTSPGVYINFSDPSLLKWMSDPLQWLRGSYTMEAALLANVVGSASKLGRYALLKEAWPFDLFQANDTTNPERARSVTAISHLPRAGGTYVDLTDQRIFETKEKMRRDFIVRGRRHGDCLRELKAAMIDACFRVPDKRRFLLATWQKERDWMLGRLREDEFRYLLEWVGTTRSRRCNLKGCPCGYGVDLFE